MVSGAVSFADHFTLLIVGEPMTPVRVCAMAQPHSLTLFRHAATLTYADVAFLSAHTTISVVVGDNETQFLKFY